uniref:CDP-diacylglycerol--glycerol-3-phosphate 3-phosphatidyltransferase n=1 Tax=Candidatus Kentrum sp. FW TaxID=2126338 RepID=A0A450TGS0_9GAMM|nr:MAG: Phosphatidylglycerophosphate synthase [Candidatus Kentron sp. FW]
MGVIRDRIPNALSLSRIPASMLFVAIYSSSSAKLYWVAVSICTFSLVTDYMDGYLARRWQVDSVTGYFLDGLGDKTFTVAFALVVAREHPEYIVMAWLIITREIILYSFRAIDDEQESNIRSLRIFSLLQAFFLRVFFLMILIEGWHLVYAIEKPYFFYYLAYPGYFSIFFGYCSIVFLSMSIIKRKPYKELE